MAKYTLQGECIAIGDVVFDVSATRGLGRVVNLNQRGIEVQFGTGPRIIYKEDGAQHGKARPSLFWRDPILVVPAKNESLWVHQKQVAIAVRNALLGVPK